MKTRESESYEEYLLLCGCFFHHQERLPLLGDPLGTAFPSSLKGMGQSAFRSRRVEEYGTLFFVRRASIWSLSTFVRDFSALALWMYSINTRLFLKTLPLDFWYREWYLSCCGQATEQNRETRKYAHKCLSIFPPSRYFLNRRRRTRCLLIH